jgi:hypothetical protein
MDNEPKEEIRPIEELKQEEPPVSPPAAPRAPLPPPRPPVKEPKPPASAVIKRGPGRVWKVLGIVGGAVVLTAIIFFVFFYRVQININPTPTPDKILLDGKEVNPGVYHLIPKQHSVTITKEGFISFREDKKFRFGERQNLNFKLVPIENSKLIATGATLPSLSSDGKTINFVSSDGKLSSVSADPQGKQTPVALSNGSYQNIRQLLFSDNSSFALLLDSEALKVVDFSRPDLINQTEAKLPPLASAIHSVTWNKGTSQYFPQANSQIIYDFDVDYGWTLMFANRNHTQSEALMQLDKKNFSSMWLDWGENPTQVLLAGGELGVLDLTNRQYQTISKQANFKWARWGPKGTYAVALDDQNNVYALKGGKLSKTGLKSKPGLISFTAENEIILADEGRPISFNFDTMSSINYAEIKGLENSTGISVLAYEIYFTDPEGLKEAQISALPYKI